MAGNGNSKKRRKPSPSSSVSSTPAQSKKTSHKRIPQEIQEISELNNSDEPQSKQHSHKRKTREIVELDNSDEEVVPTDQDNANPGSTQGSKTQELTDEQELRKARRVHKNQLSSCYAYYNSPHLSDQKDKNGRLMIAYQCKTCGNNIHRPIYDTSPRNLSKHVATCTKKAKESKSQSLAALGISGTGNVDAQEVPQLCAIWCAEAAHPFSALGELAHKAILHPVVIQNLPRAKANHKGAMYLGLDAWQSPNGFDILGTVIYRLVELEGDVIGFKLEAMPLDLVRLEQSHTGEYLAETVQTIVEKFGLKDKIYGIVTNNATNNQRMIDTIGSFRWPCFKGEPQWIWCFAHILNLIAQVILRPFGSHKKQTRLASLVEESENDEESNNPEAQIQFESEDETEFEDSEGPPTNTLLAAELIDNKEIELEDEDVQELTISQKLKKSPNSKALFIELCQEHECLKPHNIPQDVRTRWNATLLQLESIIRCLEAIIDWQKDRRHGPSRNYHINKSNLDLARDLVEVLQPFYVITQQVSTGGAGRISGIVVFINQITGHLYLVISDKQEKYPPALRNACWAGLQLTNKYYTLTDCSPLYRVAMILHPSFKDKYFKLAKWKPEWISEAIRLTREMWDTYYKPEAQPTTSQPPSRRASQPTTGVHVGLIKASESRGGTSLTDPLQTWLAGGLALTKEGRPVNPLKWWKQQQSAGNTHGGLLQMALDVLSCPGEISFSRIAKQKNSY
ncbi:hypothetical protein PTTG_09403 [Puccinia triticina 1-1 BBBD Race 1]|uniref:DUF659 domain-containing protein n=1 Tax=Puccinia triticina (isolate 1-1 / race 1 (BBBD)) TaxID=630390 RepID=A0A180H1L7_PUCT1|nr:hypothetical protein PTTG_09403 [Puccinia triticina 1-1 BBBD Race 1]